MFKKPSRIIDRVFIHCSASDNKNHDNIATIDKWHRERGFAGVGYHYFIRKDGTLEEGRDLERNPAAQRGHNKGTIAICLHGLKSFTEDQFETLAALCVDIDDAYNHKVTFHGHCEVSSKTCPVFDYRRVLDLTPKGYMRRAKKLASEAPAKPLTQSRTMQGASVVTASTIGAEVVSEAAEKIEPIADYSDYIQLLFVVLTLVGIGLVIYARLDDRKKGFR